jgi:hypothetical protein
MGRPRKPLMHFVYPGVRIPHLPPQRPWSGMVSTETNQIGALSFVGPVGVDNTVVTLATDNVGRLGHAKRHVVCIDEGSS